MNPLSKMTVAVSVATVWTTPESPRANDEPALGQPARMDEWLKGMAINDKLDLCQGNRVQTQILYGTEVLKAEEKGDWVKIYIPDQSTRKQPSGYPGWVPKRQLVEKKEKTGQAGTEEGEQWAVVVSDRASITFQHSPYKELELSFLTRLPLLTLTDERAIVDSPHGAAYIKLADVQIVDQTFFRSGLPQTDTQIDKDNTGSRIVQQGLRFLGRPYLWGGMSSFGYDCSGFAYNMHKSQGIVIPRDASDQAEQGIAIKRERLEPGDLMFFAYEKGKGRVHHVGIYAGNNRMLHSPDSSSCIEIVDLDGYKLIHEHCVSRRYW